MKIKKGDRVTYRYKGRGESVEATVSYVSTAKRDHSYIATDEGDRLFVPNHELTKI